MPIRRIKLTPDEKVWISEILKSISENKCPDDFQLLRKCSGRISSSFEPHALDDRLRSFQKELNIYGIYCRDPSNEYIGYVDNIIKHIQKHLRMPDNAQNPCSFSAEELSKALKIPPTQVKVSLKLISHAPHYYDGGGGKINELGYSSIEIKSFQTAKNYLNYDSIDRILGYFYTHYGQDEIKASEEIPIVLAKEDNSNNLPKITTSFPQTPKETIKLLKDLFAGKQLSVPLLRQMEEITEEAGWTDQEKADIFGVTREWYNKQRMKFQRNI